MTSGRAGHGAIGWVTACVVGLLTTAAAAQPRTPAPAVEAMAVAGEPFGVGCVIVTPPADPHAQTRPATRPGSDEAYHRYREIQAQEGAEVVALSRLGEKNNRVLYPVFVSRRQLSDARGWRGEADEEKEEEPASAPAQTEAKKQLMSLVGKKDQRGSAVLFVFTGAGPLDLTLTRGGDASAPVPRTQVTPAPAGEMHDLLQELWWSAQCRKADEAGWSDECSPVVQTYVVNMLARRLKLKAPDTRGPRWSWLEGDRLFGALLGTESIRLAIQKSVLLEGDQAQEKATEPLPEAALPAAVELPPIEGKVAIEPIALHTPAECFYVRCGSYRNFRWLREFVDRWGSRVRDGVSSRAIDYRIHDRLQEQLCLKETFLSKLLGDAAVADVALIGMDGFVREGAAIGVLFQQTKGNSLLAGNLARQRQNALEADKAAKESTVEIAGRKVSLIATSDNRVRSFYAVDGDYHLVTTSSAMVKRFVEAGAGKKSLGGSDEFRWARSCRPGGVGDKAFVYLSDAFFRNLLTPAYRVEMTRRMRAQEKIELVHLARCAARGEGKSDKNVADLVAGGFLPATFAGEPDGSRIEIADGRVLDSLRGARGSFLPTPDAGVDRVTPGERRAYLDFTEAYGRNWKRMDPVIVGIGQTPNVRAGVQRVTVDLHLTPYAPSRYGFLGEYLSMADALEVAPVAGDLVWLQVLVAPQLWRMGTTQPADAAEGGIKRFFGALRDSVIPFKIVDGEVIPSDGRRQWDYIRGYLGETPQTRFLEGLFGRTEMKEPDKDGYSAYGGGEKGGYPWFARVWENLCVASNTKETLEAVTPKLKLAPAARPAQIRLRVGEFAGTKLAEIMNAGGYLWSRKTSAGNVYFMHGLIRELGARPEDARQIAQDILGAQMVCPLGGEYQLDPKRPGLWHSTAWTTPTMAQIDRVPPGFLCESLTWFKGLALEFSMHPPTQSLTTRLELDLSEP